MSFLSFVSFERTQRRCLAPRETVNVDHSALSPSPALRCAGCTAPLLNICDHYMVAPVLVLTPATFAAHCHRHSESPQDSVIGLG